MTRNSLVLSTLFIATGASAGQADLCYGPNQALGANSPPSNSTVFNCPQAGNKTVPQLAADGWRIVQLTPVTTSQTTQADQLIIQKP